MKIIFICTIAFVALASCEVTDDKTNASKPILTSHAQQNLWENLWYDGNAEISTYDVQQARYKDIHPGKTVLIFVTEDFLTDRQVKNESNKTKHSTSVLKTNIVRHFNTGIYDYSIMSSIFTPIDKKKYPKTLKVTTSSQDWCGHSWMQLNHEKSKYRISQYSYFEKEGDKQLNVDDVFTEDEIFNQIRINPKALPKGEQRILPGTVFARLKHIPFQPSDVQITHEKSSSTEFNGEHLMVYSLVFPDFNRTLEIYYEEEFPHNIAGWKDSYPSYEGKVQTSVAKQITTKRMPYWSQHNLEDAHLRAEIGL